MTDELEKIARLLALSGSDNEHEARSAAVHAARLIREGIASGKLTLSAAGTTLLQQAKEVSQGRGGAWEEMKIRRTGTPTIQEVKEAIEGNARAKEDQKREQAEYERARARSDTLREKFDDVMKRGK